MWVLLLLVLMGQPIQVESSLEPGVLSKLQIHLFMDGFSTTGNEPIQRQNYWEHGQLSH
jgi:hypothetical protein